MHLRLMNKLDLNGIGGHIKNIFQPPEAMASVWGRVRTAVEILDTAYGEQRSGTDMGGFVFFATSEQDKKEVLDFYSLDEKLAEYSDTIIQVGSVTWHEELYLRSSEDAVIIIYPAVKQEKEES